MSKRDHGSKSHFLRYRREKPVALDQAILNTIGQSGGTIEWIYPTGNVDEGEEPEGLDFLKGNKKIEETWPNFWPQTGKPITWDGVARLLLPQAEPVWLLFEAKANHPEFCSPPSESKGHGHDMIEAAMAEVKRYLGVHRHFPWLGTYYQHANRLAVLYFLQREGISARLIDLLFTGDRFPDGTPCPQSEGEWRELIRGRALTLGLPERYALSERVHEMFLPVK